ncbi:MAG: nucleotide exchange factor GrpE [Chitinophagales bacterium]|nr:nucleotide exchange factor GrpE [Chitinophagales bacterium]
MAEDAKNMSGGSDVVSEEPKESTESTPGKEFRLKRRAAFIRLKEEIVQQKEKNTDLKDKYLRLLADFDNFKKRSAKEWIEKNKEAGKEVIVPMLTVLDDFERALRTMKTSDNIESIREGSELIFNKLKKNLEQKGLEPMESIGQPFDPERHDAITEIPAQMENDKGKVMDEIERGYLINGKIIRHAKVVVGK